MLSAVGITHGKSTAPRIIRLNQSCSFKSSASAIPSTSFSPTAALVKTKPFWNVWRKESASHRATKFRKPTKWLGRPMKAFDIAR